MLFFYVQSIEDFFIDTVHKHKDKLTQ